jgi:phosphatidylglycerophosphatase A
MDSVLLWIAQGFSIGRIPWMPGTFGSVLGLLWVSVLLVPGTAWAYAVGALLGLASSVWICGRAEKILGQTDPGSVVLDEIAALPLCCASWLVVSAQDLPQGTVGSAWLFTHGNWVWAAGIFLAFRFFDIVKPWPVRQSQRLPGGWGVTIDDALAAGYVNIVVLVAWKLANSWRP